MAGHLAERDQWLFPGRRPGHPMHPTSLSHRLRGLGIEPRAARNTALLQLAAELPSLVLADLLGIHINTAERWNAAVGAPWANYAAAPRFVKVAPVLQAELDRDRTRIPERNPLLVFLPGRPLDLWSRGPAGERLNRRTDTRTCAARSPGR
jgi:hypothetical protein